MKSAILASLSAALMLGGCSGGGSDGTRNYVTPTAAFEGRAGEALEMAERLDSYAFTRNSQMPTSGSARFDGFAAGLVETPGRELVLVGVAELNANFGSGRIGGTLSDFTGGYSEDGIAAYRGNVRLTNGMIGTPVQNAFVTDYGGTLIGNGETVVLGGDMQGVFKGNPIRGLIAATNTGAASVNGTPATSSLLAIVAER